MGIAPEEAVGGSIGPDVVFVTENLHGGLLNPDPTPGKEVVGQFGISPIGPIQATGGGSVNDPLTQGGCKVVGELGYGTRAFAGVEPFESAFEVGVEPSLDGARRDAQVTGDVLVRSVAMSQANDLNSITELAVGGGAKRSFQRRLLTLRKLNANHGYRCH